MKCHTHGKNTLVKRYLFYFETVCDECKKIRDAAWFAQLITVTIIVVGIVIGADTDQFMHCERYARRVARTGRGACLSSSSCLK